MWLNAQTALAQSVESILDSLISAELEMNNLPYDNVNDLIKGLQILITNLAEYKQQNYAIARSLPVNADSHVRAAVEQIDERIDLLRQRAENGLEKIQLMEVTECSTEEEMRRRKEQESAVLNDLRAKEQYLRDVLDKTESYLVYKDVSDRTVTLRENLTLLIRILREKALILENNIQRLANHLQPAATVEQTVQPQTVDIESQTSPLASMEPVPVSLDIVRSEVQVPATVAVSTQESSVQTQPAPEHTTDNILIIQSVVNGRETVQISNVPRAHGIADQPLEESVVVEAKYTQPAEGKESERSSELLVKNIPTQFETTFVEPDETTTEIVVNRDGSKKITLRKVVQPAQSIESTITGKASIVTSVELAPEQSDAPAITAEESRVVVDVEGVDVVLEEQSTEQKQQEDPVLEASSPPAVSDSPVLETAQTVVEEVLEQLEQKLITAEQAVEQQQPDEPSQYVCVDNVPERSIPVSPVHVRTEETVEVPVQRQESEEAQQVWPTSPERGSDYIEIEPNVMKPQEVKEEETIVPIVMEEATLEHVAVDRNQEIEVPIVMEGVISVSSVPEPADTTGELLEQTVQVKEDLPVPTQVTEVPVETIVVKIEDESKQLEPIETVIVEAPTLTDEPTLEIIETTTLSSEPVVETTITRTSDTIEDSDSCTTIVETVVITKTTTTEEVIEIPVEVEQLETTAGDDQDETVLIEKVTHVTTIVEHVMVEGGSEDAPERPTIEEITSEPSAERALVKQEQPAPPELVDDETNLQVQVASIGETQSSSLRVSMTVDPTETKKISVSLIEIKPSTGAALEEEGKQTAAPESLEFEEISGLKAVEVDPGYEADKTATAEGEPDDDDKGKKKRKRKKKGKNENEKASNTDQSGPEPKPAAPADGRLSVAQESEQRFDSYQSFTEEDQPQVSTVNVLEEAVEPEMIEVPITIQEKIVVPTEVIEAIYTEDVQQQTTPIEFASGRSDSVDVEIEKITSERLMVPIDWEQRSMQTSPEPVIQRTSQQTSPLTIEQEGTEQETKEIQTTAVEAAEIETQTAQPVELIQQEAQTDTVEESPAAAREIDTVDMANQTVPIETKETQQQAENAEEIVGPILGQIVKEVIDPATLYKPSSMQTSPVHFAEDAEAPKEGADVQTADESAQTSFPEVQDANVETGDVAQPSAPILESVDMQTVQVPTMESDAQTTPVTVTEITETVTISTQTKQQESAPAAEEVVEPTHDDKESKNKRDKKKKSKKSKDKSIPIEVEVSTQMVVPSMSAAGVPLVGAVGSESVTVTKTIITEGKSADGQGDVGLNIQVDIDPSFGTVEQSTMAGSAKPSTTVSCPINESLDTLQSQNLQLSLSDCFSIIKSQQNYAENRVIPWQDINRMMMSIKFPSVSSAEGDDQRGNAYPIICSTSLPTEEDDTGAANDDLQHVLQLLQENENDPAAQQHLLFNVVENVVKSLEDLDTGVAQANVTDGSSPVDRAKLHRVYKIRLIRIEEHIVKIITYVQRSKTGPNKEVDECLNHLLRQVKALEQTVADGEQKLDANATELRTISGKVRALSNTVAGIEGTFSDLVSNDTMFIATKLCMIREFEMNCRVAQNSLMACTNEYNSRDLKSEDDGKLADEMEQIGHQLRRLENGLVLESNKLIQLGSLAEEYEQTLFEFQEITATAEVFIENEIVTNSLEELQEEMQRYRKFFVNLNHCKAILESLETNLDPLTRQKYAELHSSLYNRTKVILERAVDRAGKLALAASRWTVLEKDMVAEQQWLQVAQQRVPDLSNVSSQDYERYITMYESLDQDIGNHLTKLRSHNETARRMQELISAPIVEKESNDALVVAMQLKEEVSLYLRLLTKFKTHWNQYNVHADRLGDWVHQNEGRLAYITIEKNLSETSVDHMRTFWEIKAQYEVLNNKVYKSACETFDRALDTIPVTDEQLQRQLHGQLLDNWYAEELKACISMFDVQRLHKRVWTLWQIYSKLEQRIVLQVKRSEEASRNRKLFLEHYHSLTEWMRLFENKLNDTNKYESCTDDQVFIRSMEESMRQELALKECEKDWLTSMGKDLLAHCSTVEEHTEIMNHLEKLHAQWDYLWRLCDSRAQKISEIEVTMRSLELRIAELRAWMETIERELRMPFAVDSLEKTNLDRLLDDYEKLQRSIEGNSGNVAEVLNLCEMLFIDVQSWNVHINRRSIQNDAKDLDWRWKNVCMESGRRKQDLLALWNMLLELQKIAESHQQWVHEQHAYVRRLEQSASSLDGDQLADELESIAIRMNDVVAQEPIQCIMRRLYISVAHHDRISADGLRFLTAPAQQMLLLWERLHVSLTSLRTEVERYRTEYGTFVMEYERIILALTQIDVQVTQIEHIPPEQTADGPLSAEARIDRLRELHSELLFVVNLFEKEDTLGAGLIERHANNNTMTEDIRQKMAEYHELGNSVKTRLDALLTRATEAFEVRNEKEVAVQVNTLRLERSESITAKDAYRYQLETALTES
uniref:KASH domain-containing protein n=1 Tax=Anopheles coluzzii TaxID=1518534 RepID=A0A8W7PJE7_ANOCL